MRHGTNGFTSAPKEEVLRIFSPWNIRRLRPGVNPRTWVPKASTLPLHHRSRFDIYLCDCNIWEPKNPQFKISPAFKFKSHIPACFFLYLATILFNCMWYTVSDLWKTVSSELEMTWKQFGAAYYKLNLRICLEELKKARRSNWRSCMHQQNASVV